MREAAKQLEAYVRERVGDGLQGVGYHTGDDHEVVYLRDDVAGDFPPEGVRELVSASRDIEAAVGDLPAMGRPRASLHSMQQGLVIQFYRGDGVVFLGLDDDVGRNFTRFLDDCIRRVDWP